MRRPLRHLRRLRTIDRAAVARLLALRQAEAGMGGGMAEATASSPKRPRRARPPRVDFVVRTVEELAAIEAPREGDVALLPERGFYRFAGTPRDALPPPVPASVVPPPAPIVIVSPLPPAPYRAPPPAPLPPAPRPSRQVAPPHVYGDGDAFERKLAAVAAGRGIVERIPMRDRRYENVTLGGVGGEINL